MIGTVVSYAGREASLARGVALLALVACSSRPSPPTISTEPIAATEAPGPSSCEGEACRAACERGDAAACTRAADRIYPGDRDAARALYESACATNEPVACYRLLEETGEERYARRACASGAVAGCNFLSEWSVLAFAAPRPAENKEALFELARQTSARACDLGSFRSCVNAVSLLRYRGADSAAISPLAAKALTLAEADCASERLGACAFVADWANRAGDRVKELEFRSRECAIDRRLELTIVGPDGQQTPVRGAGKQPTSCERVVELGGDPDTVGTSDNALPERERVVPRRAVEARRISGTTQIQPGEAEVGAIRAGKRPITANFKLCLSKRGGVTMIRTLNASAFPDWNRRLFEAITTWRYTPFTVEGEPVPVCTAITFVYKPRSR